MFHLIHINIRVTINDRVYSASINMWEPANTRIVHSHTHTIKQQHTHTLGNQLYMYMKGSYMYLIADTVSFCLVHTCIHTYTFVP